MITTRFGSEVKVLKPADDEGWVKCTRVSDNTEKEYHASELKCSEISDMTKLYAFKIPEAAS